MAPEALGRMTIDGFAGELLTIADPGYDAATRLERDDRKASGPHRQVSVDLRCREHPRVRTERGPRGGGSRGRTYVSGLSFTDGA
jgi:hypothetical protein